MVLTFFVFCRFELRLAMVGDMHSRQKGLRVFYTFPKLVCFGAGIWRGEFLLWGWAPWAPWAPVFLLFRRARRLFRFRGKSSYFLFFHLLLRRGGFSCTKGISQSLKKQFSFNCNSDFVCLSRCVLHHFQYPLERWKIKLLKNKSPNRKSWEQLIV